MTSHPDFAGQWLRQRDSGARAVAEVEAEELRLLTVAEAADVDLTVVTGFGGEEPYVDAT